jgi:mannose/cellobiose epimerase-like protein (N-acyl-D-glucosamine 2-epimerase family)
MIFKKLYQLSIVMLVLTSAIFSQTELIRNGTFSSGSTNWNLGKYGGSSSGSVSSGEYAIIVTTPGTEYWNVQFTQGSLSLGQGKTYRFSFDAYKGTQNSGTQTMQVNIGQSASPYTSYFGTQNKLVTLATTKTHYSYLIAMTNASDANARVEFNCGNSTGGYYIDNVSLLEETVSTPQLRAIPMSIDFGNVTTGTDTTINITMQNAGNATTTISAIQTSSSVFTTGMTLPATVAASGNITLPVTFSPSSAGEYSGSVTIYSNASDNPVITANVSGSAVLPGIGISSSSIAISSAPGTPATRTITLSNSGLVPITWSIISNSAWATVTPASGSINAQSEVTCTITANSSSQGDFSGSLSLTHSASNQPSPMSIGMSFTVTSGYQPTCPYILNPELGIDFVRTIANFRSKQRDNVNGGYYTNINRQGYSTGANEKALCGQSRIAYAFTRAFMLTGEEQYLEMAHHALKFLYTHGWNNGWYFITDSTGNYIDHWGHNDWWSFQQHYALIGISAMVEATGGNMNWNDGTESDHTWLMRGVNSNYTKLWDSRAATKGYYNYSNRAWTNKWGKGFTPTVDGVTTHGLLLALMYDSLNHKQRFIDLADNIVDHLIASMSVATAGFPENYDANWNVDNSSTSMDIGHGYKTAWVLQRAYLRNPDHPQYLSAAQALMQNLWDHGCYDTVNGAPYSYLNWKTGEVTSTNKDFWMTEQGFTSGIMSYYTAATQEQRDMYLRVADGSLNFFMDHIIDPVYGEAYNVVNRDGSTVVDANKGGLFTAGYHSSELGYYAYLYSSLYYHKSPVQLYYYYPQENTERTFKLTPIAIEENVLKITAVTLDGVPYTDFNSDSRTLHLAPGVGGKFRVTFGFTPVQTFTISATAGSGGAISPSGSVTVVENNAQAFTITPNAGYTVSDVLVDGISVGAVSSYTFSSVNADHSIAASFAAIPVFTITATAGSGGTISPSGSLSVLQNGSRTFTITPDAGYTVSDVLVDGVSAGPLTTYAFSNVTADHPIAASFAAVPVFTITATAGSGGTISPSGSLSVLQNGSRTFTITPDAGYTVSDVLVDGVSAGPLTTYAFSNVTADHTIAASFAAVPVFTITATAGSGGTISPSGSLSVLQNGSRTFTITPDAGYTVSDVLVDGVSAGPLTTYAFSNVTANHTISAVFTIRNYTITASASAGGSITPSGTVSVQHGSSQGFTITPAAGYQISGVMVDGISAGTVGTYSFSNVMASHTINASFSVISSTVYQINCGSSSAASPYAADQYYSGGTMHTVTNTIDLSGVTDPAPASVYKSERYGNATYTIPGLVAGNNYKVRLHMAELYQTSTGKRRFNVAINGTTVLSNFDIYAVSGARYKALVREFTTVASTSGNIVITLTTVTDNASISGIEVVAAAPNNPPTIATAASASPAVVLSTSSVLSVIGADDNGETNLTYTWAATVPPGATVTFSANGSNAAKTTTATFTMAGNYTFQVTAKDAGNLTATSAVSVTVNQTASGIAISPASVTLDTSAGQQFSATVYDQFANAISSMPVTWGVSGNGTISPSGLFTAGKTTGTATVSASSGTLNGTAQVTVQTAGNSVVIYGDALATTYYNYSWSSTCNFNDATPVKVGTRSLSITYSSGWAALFLQKASGTQSHTGFTAYSFWAHGGTGSARQCQFFTRSSSGAESKHVTVSIPANTWTLITIPLSSLGNPSDASAIMLQESSGSAQAEFNIDQLELK